jgi:hypothetical protein
MRTVGGDFNEVATRIRTQQMKQKRDARIAEAPGLLGGGTDHLAMPQKAEETFSRLVSVLSAVGRMPFGILLKVIFGLIQEGFEIHAGLPDRVPYIEFAEVFQFLIGKTW